MTSHKADITSPEGKWVSLHQCNRPHLMAVRPDENSQCKGHAVVHQVTCVLLCFIVADSRSEDPPCHIW